MNKINKPMIVMMKKIVYLAGCLLWAGALCWSCSDDGNGGGDGDGKGGIVLDKSTQTEQVIYANDKGIKDEGIRFTTQGPWKAEVEEVTTKADVNAAPTVDWLALSQYSGDKAGDYTITLTLKQNFTGMTRKAVIRIICGDTVITITVEQKAEKEDGMKLKRVKSVNYEEILGDGYKEEHTFGKAGDKASYTYSYDERGRVAKVVYNRDESNGERSTITYRFDYRIVGEITVDCHYESRRSPDNEESEDDYKYFLTLNGQGNVVRIKKNGHYYEDRSVQAGYTEDGYLAKWWGDRNKYGKSWYEKFYYTDGLLTKTESWETGDSTWIQEFSVDRLYPHRIPSNGTNIDFNAFVFMMGEEYMEKILYQIGLFGKGSDCLLEINFAGYDKPSSAIAEDYTKKPDKVYKLTEKYTVFPEKEVVLPVKYEFDGDKYVNRFSYIDPYEWWEYYYEVHVGHELIDSERPDMGYKYEIKNERRKKLRDEKNAYVYTVVYE